MIGFEIKKTKKESKTGVKKDSLANSVRLKWTQIDENIKELVVKSIEYALEELTKEKENRLRAEEQSA